MSTFITDTFTTVSNNIVESFKDQNFTTNSSKIHTKSLQQTFNDTLLPTASLVATFLNKSWLPTNKTETAALIAASDTWSGSFYQPTGSSPSAQININSSFKMPNVHVVNTSVPAHLLENFINVTSTTSIMPFVNSSMWDAEGASATETPYVPYVMRPETYIVPVLFAFIFIIGVLGNGTLIVVFLAVRSMRNVPNT